MKKIIVFFPQNKNQEENFVELANELISLHKEINIDDFLFILVPDAFGENYSSANNFRKLVINWSTERPIYLLGYIKRFTNLIANRKKLKKLKWLKGNILIIGNDGVLQRYLINRIGFEKIFIICDTIIFPIKEKLKFYIPIFQFLSKLKISHYFPGLTFHTPNDGIFVSNNNNKKILEKQSIKNFIYVCDMPLHAKNRETFYNIRKLRKKTEKISVLYVTSAFKWHKLYFEDKLQRKDLMDLCFFSEKNKDLRVRVRIHPREQLSNYSYLKTKCKDLEISGKNGLTEDLAWSDIVITATSSVAYEAQQLGILTFIYRKNFGSVQPTSIFSNGYNIIDRIDDILIKPDNKNSSRQENHIKCPSISSLFYHLIRE